jgi:hypothetical protein
MTKLGMLGLQITVIEGPNATARTPPFANQ